MNALKLIFALFIALLLTTGVFAFVQNDNVQSSLTTENIEEAPEISVASTISLFNFIYLAEEKTDSTQTEPNRDSNNIQIMDLIQTFF